MMIIMTTEQATAVRGETAPGHALDPVPLVGGSFALPVAVLADPAHATAHGALAGLPQRMVEPEEFERPADEE